MESWIWYVIVAAMWGGSNPLLKRGVAGLENVTPYSWAGPLGTWAAETVYLFTTPSYVVPFAINQTGSLLFLATLGSSRLSSAVPIVNALTFAFTALMGMALGERVSSNIGLTFAGMVLVSAGIFLCVSDP